MDSKTLLNNSQYFSLNGYVLSPKEKAALSSSLLLLQNRHKFVRVVYWGKVNGTVGDYYVSQGFTTTENLEQTEEQKLSFYSLDGVTWLRLAKIEDFEYQYLEKIRGYFRGDPSFAYDFEKQHDLDVEDVPVEKKESTGEDGEEEENEENEEEVSKPSKPMVQIREETRLRYVVDKIDFSGSVVPRGSFILTSDERIVQNQTFQGLNEYESGKLANYIHLRKPESKTSQSVLEKDSLSKTFDFGDTIDNDIPSKAWSIQFDDSRNVVVGKSLLWPGYVFFHVPKTSTFGSFYIGDGSQNFDLCFMLRDETSIPKRNAQEADVPEPVLINSAEVEEDDE